MFICLIWCSFLLCSASFLSCLLVPPIVVPFVCVRLALLNLPFSYRADVLFCVWSVFLLLLPSSCFFMLLPLFLFPFACVRRLKLNLPYSYPADINLILCDFLSCFFCLSLFYGPYLCEVVAVIFSILRFS